MGHYFLDILYHDARRILFFLEYAINIGKCSANLQVGYVGLGYLSLLCPGAHGLEYFTFCLSQDSHLFVLPNNIPDGSLCKTSNQINYWFHLRGFISEPHFFPLHA